MDRLPPTPATSPALLREQLQASLGSAFTIERELGRGGMSHVFLAREHALGRVVVVKVLSPELAAGVNAERFRREIQLAARLQHPHVVPVHMAGEAMGLPYFTMPFVDGESLRARLARGGALPLGDAARILHDLVDAIAYAHEHGIVHRDIKPDNVLLTRQHALITDFGVAKAISAANVGGHGAGTPTETAVGIAIGTPAYMAPEQAAADPATDHRADIYALGVLAYEMLTGAPPFTKRPPHEILQAHLVEEPKPLDTRVAGALAPLVIRCLAKDPGERPSAAELRATLEALATPSGGMAPARAPLGGVLRPLAIAAVGILALVGLGAAAARWWPRPTPLDPRVVAIVPFHVATEDPSLQYLREGMVDLLAAKLTGDGGPRAADPRTVFAAWRGAGGSDSTDLPRERTRDVAKRLGAGQLLLGEVVGSRERIALSASLIGVRDGIVRASANVEGHADSLATLVDRLTAQLLALGAGEQEQRLATLTGTPLPALRNYLQGQWYYRNGRFRQSAQSFNRALDVDSSFALAALGLVAATGWIDDADSFLRSRRLAWQYRDRLSDRDRLLLEATVGANYPAPSPMSQLLAAKERFAQLAPDRAEAWFELGDAYFHYGTAVGAPDARQRAESAFRRALSLDPAYAPALEHLQLLAARAGDTATVRDVTRRYLATDSTRENTGAVRWRQAIALGDSAALAALDREFASLSSLSAQEIIAIGQSDGVDMPRVERAMALQLSRATTDYERGLALALAHDLALNRGRPALARAYADSARGLPTFQFSHNTMRVLDALFWDGDTVEAAASVRDIARAASSATASPIQRFSATCVTELWRLARGDTSATAASLARMRELWARAPSEAGPGICQHIVEALYSSLSGSPDAPALVQRLDSAARTVGASLYPVANLVVARLREQQGDVQGALAAVRRREYFLGRPLFLSTMLREEGRLAALAGDREGAIRAYRRYIILREDPEPALKPDLERARAELERLERGSVGQ